MAVATEDKQQIAEVVKEIISNMNLVERSSATGTTSSIDDRFYALNERIVRVEEELKHQRDIIINFQKQVDKRFEEMQHNLDKRFEQVYKRFEENMVYMNKHFEQIDKRFEEMQRNFDKRFEENMAYMNKRFEQVDKRFAMIQWLMGIGFVSLAALISVIKIFG